MEWCSSVAHHDADARFDVRGRECSGYTMGMIIEGSKKIFFDKKSTNIFRLTLLCLLLLIFVVVCCTISKPHISCIIFILIFILNACSLFLHANSLFKMNVGDAVRKTPEPNGANHNGSNRNVHGMLN